MLRSKLIGLLVALLAAAAVGPVAAAAVDAGSLTTSDVVLDAGVSRPAGDLARLRAAAKDLAAKGFPTKFVVIAKPAADMDREARRLRRDLSRTLGPDAVDAVIVIAPKRLGVNAKVLDCERGLAMKAEAQTVKSDDVQGAINVARRLQAYDEQQALRDENCNEVEPQGGGGGDDGGKKGLLIVLLAAGVVLIGAIVFFARRASRQPNGEPPAGTEAEGDAPPPGGPPETSGAADAPDHDG